MTQTSGYGKQKVVYHLNISNPGLLKSALTNIQNHVNAVGKDNLAVKVVMHGDGVDLLRIANEDTDFQEKIIKLKSQNVGFGVCNNTLVARGINYQTDLYGVSQSDIVQSGVAELAKLQQQGYAYIKP
ncbi:MAG: DsrE family protein [Acidiferrobacterales bacterium]